MQTHAEPALPSQIRPTYDAIVALSDRFCQANLTHEYQVMCRRLTAVLARKRPSPLTRGKPEVWACAILRVIGWVNFLDDSSQKLHMKLTAIDKAFGVAESTGQGKAKAIRDMLKICTFDPDWTLPSRRNRLPKPLTLSFGGLITIHRLIDDSPEEEVHVRQGDSSQP
jgi:hypothetical protein